jgi:hypothetical protein
VVAPPRAGPARRLEQNKTKLAGIDTNNPSTDTFTQFDCAQYDAKRKALPSGKK